MPIGIVWVGKIKKKKSLFLWLSPVLYCYFLIFAPPFTAAQALLVQARRNITNVLHNVARIPSDLQHGVLASPAAPPPEHLLPTRLQPEEALQALQLEVRRAQCHPHLCDLALSLGLLHWWVTSGAAASEPLLDHQAWGDETRLAALACFVLICAECVDIFCMQPLSNSHKSDWCACFFREYHRRFTHRALIVLSWSDD